MYPESTKERILERMAQGASLNSICREDGMPSIASVFRWLDEDKAFQEKYARAINMRADVKFDELDDVSEEAAMAESAVRVAGLRLKADNIKWQLARMNAKKYGEKAETTLQAGESITELVRTIVRV